MLEIYVGGPSLPVEDLAFEAWMLDRAAEGCPCFFATSWPGPVVVLGYGQPPDEVDLDFCSRSDIPVYRRLTGGTGVLHQGDLGISLALPGQHPWAQGVIGLYDRFLSVLEPALQRFEPRVERKLDPPRASRIRSPICFLDQLSDTLLVDGRKAVGCAQTRRKGAVLIHAAILLGLDADLCARVFRTDPDEVRSGLTAAVAGGDWTAIGRGIWSDLADELGLEALEKTRKRLPPSYLEAYREKRWAPVGCGLVW